MTYINPDSEAALEAATLALFRDLAWQTIDCFHETFGPVGILGREHKGEVVLRSRLLPALRRLNPDVPADALAQAADELTRDRSTMSLAQANREVYHLLKDGVKITYQADDDEGATVTIRIIDWSEEGIENNDFLIASQLWITGPIYTRRTDLIGFVNGLPLLFVELKAAHRHLEHAYHDNLRDYKDTIPHLFWYNAVIILSNGAASRVGSLTAEWDHFADWKKINSEEDEGVISLDTTIRGTCLPARLLDIVENFILFSEASGGLVKLVAKYHQYFGVNNAVKAVRYRGANAGRLGVFWHTQGAGKSYSMAFFAQKVLRKLPGNWTFVVVTDRDDLDGQIYKNFARAGVVTESETRVRARSAEHLKQLLREDHRLVFTLIQKFRTERGATYPTLSDRSDIIVVTDEAHRSQYDIFALNMRNALPNAGFIGFTGTPLMVGEERTRQVFGDYVSIYNFKQSVDDHATVPLYYENRIPELQLTNLELNLDMEDLLDQALLDEAEEARVEREFAREYQLITREDRLDRIAEDIVAHFIGRGHQGKAMVVCIDKATAVRMYDKVQKYWTRTRKDLETRLAARTDQSEREALQKRVAYMRETDMAVVVSATQNEAADFARRGLDITRHRRRMQTEDLDEKFKDSANPFRIVFVCAMWMTGFDAPSCSTIYLDKPMRNHSLMQTIARANRVFPSKHSGLIVDYIGVFRDLQKALAVYGSASGGGIEPGDTPVEDKYALVADLRQALAGMRAYLTSRGIDLEIIQVARDFQRIKLRKDAVAAILENDQTKSAFLSRVRDVTRLYKAVLPDRRANEFGPTVALLTLLLKDLQTESPWTDVGDVMAEVEDLLDESVVAGRYVIEAPAPYETAHLIDLSRLDFDLLKEQFETGRKTTEAERLRGALNAKLEKMVRRNRTRLDFQEKFQSMIDAYNQGAHTIDRHFAELLAFAQELTVEEQRGVAEQLSEEELAVFDWLTRPDVGLSAEEEAEVKRVARELLQRLKTSKLVLDWRKRQQARAAVRETIEEVLDHLPQRYTKDLYDAKVEAVYQHIYDNYYGEGRSVYGRTG